MASITIRNIEEDLKSALRLTAAEHGHSMEEEVRVILRNTLLAPRSGGLGSQIRQRFGVAGGVDLDLPRRDDAPRAATFD